MGSSRVANYTSGKEFHSPKRASDLELYFQALEVAVVYLFGKTTHLTEPSLSFGCSGVNSQELRQGFYKNLFEKPLKTPLYNEQEKHYKPQEIPR